MFHINTSNHTKTNEQYEFSICIFFVTSLQIERARKSPESTIFFNAFRAFIFIMRYHEPVFHLEYTR